ncbi:MAG TPA: ABC transporter substrate-binding protein [Acidimicrobiales bacterium]|nr:ABC transporter substrate-binding protein [Acidimicrobiales bacterium]
MRPLLRLLHLLAIAGLLLASCSSSGDGLERSADASTTTSPTTPATDAEGEPTGEPASPVLRLGLAGPMSLDPAAISPASVSSMILVDLVHDTLTRLDDDGVAQPRLATFEPNADRTVWRFHLRDDARFVDGSAITPEDVVSSIDRVRGQGGSSLAAIQLEDVQAVSPSGPNTVDFVLRSPSAVLPELLASPVYGIVDRDLLPTAVGAPLNPSGAFRVEATAPDRMVLTRWRGEGVDRVELRLFSEDAGAYEAFVAGELDWSPVPIDRLGEATDRYGQQALAPFHGSLLLGMNLRVDPLHSPEVRRAISLAIDRATLTDAVFGPTAQPMKGLIPAGVPGAAGECRGVCGPDVARARELVAQVFGGAPPPPLRLLTDDTATQTAIAGVLEEQLAAAGFEVSTASVAPAGYDEALRSGQPQLFLYSALGLGRSPASHLLPWASGSPDNVTGYANGLVDAALLAALAEPDPGVRRTRWQEVEAGILGDVPVVPLAQLRTVAVQRAQVQGLRIAADGSIDVSDVTFDGAGR